jgi:FAD/FMN-containing dehydrogenase
LNPSIDKLVRQLEPALGPEGVLTGEEAARSAGIWRTDIVRSPVIFRPANTEEVAQILRACNAAGQPVVTHGGLTGLVEGAIAAPDEVVLSTERMTRIEAINTADRTMLVQAGVTLQTAQDRAEAAGLMLPLDLGARGSCTLGGNAATNAGGHRVVRYGMTRDLVLGLEAVLADGTIISSLNGMLKNNAGYDLKQLFIGSEGTLGVITRLVMRLRPVWRSQETALLACDTFAQVGELLAHFDAALGGKLSAFEVMWQDFYELAVEGMDQQPLESGHAYYVIVEALGPGDAGDGADFLRAVERAAAAGLLTDAVVCKSGAERDAVWALRDSVEKTLTFGPALIFDVSMRLSDMEAYVAEVTDRLRNDCPDIKTWIFGHAGDGNLHLVCAAVGREKIDRDAVEAAVYEPLGNIGGSVSGEHGIGIEKKRWLAVSRDEAQIELMKRLKRTLDPHDILNRGRVVDVGAVR